MTIEYRPRGVCSSRMVVDVEEGVIRSLQVQGGCSGNLQGISRLVEGMGVEEAIRQEDAHVPPFFPCLWKTFVHRMVFLWQRSPASTVSGENGRFSCCIAL